MGKKYNLVCQHCRRPMSFRRGKKFCSGSCRVSAHLGRKLKDASVQINEKIRMHLIGMKMLYLALLLVESKGTQKEIERARMQLRKATEELMAIILPGITAEEDQMISHVLDTIKEGIENKDIT